MARSMTPCLLVLEDIDTIVTKNTRSYFFNEVDGLENNDGIMMIASTNHLDELDPGLSKRPSRFDRKYLFPLPDKGERAQYGKLGLVSNYLKMKLTSSTAQYWRNKLKNKKSIEFPGKLCDAIAGITEDFSFAYLKEAFVATLLELARNHDDDDEYDCASDSEDDPLDKYELWRTFKEQVKILRSEMASETPGTFSSEARLGAYEGFSAAYEEMMPLLENMRLQGDSQQPCKAVSSQGTNPGGRFVQNSSLSTLSPIQSFAPLAQRKSAKLNSGVWEWGL